MVSRTADRLARTLLRLAAARQPSSLRADLHREWVAELHVLAAEGRPGPLLAYALSLAVSRPAAAEPLAGGTSAAKRVLTHAVLVLLAPAFCYGLAVVSFIGMGVLRDLLFPAFLDHDVVYRLQAPSATVLALSFAVLVGWVSWWLGTQGPLRGVRLVALVVLVLVAATEALVNAVIGTEYGRATAVWLPGLLIAVLVAGRQARRGRPGRGWLLGAAIMAVAVDGAIVAQVAGTHAEDLTWHYAFAPLWLPAALADWSFGLPYPTAAELFVIGDRATGMPQLVLLLSAYAIGYAVGAARPAQAVAPSVAASDPDGSPAEPSGSGSAGTATSA
ncbi:hypothetical protein GCM10009662_09260 [Catellatospora coxensis]|uniref:Uncharacterized protein n=1 Tax=Catellatospora coxensis TaxID=310354 RepID=A0A8J3L3H9_9ACTN|nr:hypothetical protein Cco03nite_74390 [Catellatospora coxensis]